MIIHRIGTAPNFKFTDDKGDKLSKEALEYAKKLVVPPAYSSVNIYYEKNPKILFDGRDAKGRLQQIYSPAHNKKTSLKKFKSLIEFGVALPKIYKDVDNLIAGPILTKEKIIALIIKIISICYFRIGNHKYYLLYKSHGISNIKSNHVKITKDGVKVEFIGKKGMLNTCIIKDKKIIDELTKIAKTKKPNDFLFTVDGEPIKAIEVNSWLNQYGKGFSTKDFRTFDANTFLLDNLQKQHKDAKPSAVKETQRKRNVVAALKETSCLINNTAAICKKAYVNQDLVNLYITKPKAFEKRFLTGDSRLNFVEYLRGL